MTVIAWDGFTLAADRQATVADTIYSTKKLWTYADGSAVAVTGDLSAGEYMRSWYESGSQIDQWPEIQKTEDWAILVVARPGKAPVYYERHPVPITVVDQFRAWGSGREVALGAMAMGADAINAVEIASRFVIGCGRGCDSVRINARKDKNTCPCCGNSDLKRGGENLWCDECGFSPIPPFPEEK